MDATRAEVAPQLWLERMWRESETRRTGKWDERMWKVEKEKLLEQWIQTTETGQDSTLQEPRDPSNEEMERMRIEIPTQQQQHQDPATTPQESRVQTQKPSQQ